MTRRKSGPEPDLGQGELFGAAAAAAPHAPAANAAAVPAMPSSPSLLSSHDVLATLAEWAERGWIRRLDAALPRFLAEAAGGADATVLLAAALASHLEGRGHACLAIGDWLAAPDRTLGWKPEPLAALAALLAAMPSDATAWADALAASAVVDRLAPATDPADDHGSRPLVLRDGRLYLRRYWDYERRVAGHVNRRAASGDDGDDGDDGIDAVAARAWLDRLFPVSTRAGPDWQRIACAVALRGRVSVVTGGPGTGKTYTAARLLALLAALDGAPRLRIALAAPTGKAAARLRQSIDGALAGLRAQLGAVSAADAAPIDALASALGPAKTLHALLGARPDTRRFRHDAATPLQVDVLVVDEASMVHLEMMAALLDALPPTARLVLLGDKDQLASVEAGAVLGELCRDAERARYTPDTARRIEAMTGERVPDGCVDPSGPPLAQRTTMLRTSLRFGGAIGELADAVNAGDAAAALAQLPERRDGAVCRWPSATPASVVELAVAGRIGAPGGYGAYLDAIDARPPTDAAPDEVDAWARAVLGAFDRVRVLCAVRDGEWGVVDIGRAIEKRLRDDGRLAAGGEWYEGRPVLVTRNDRALGVTNGDVAIALRPSAGAAALRAYVVGGEGVRSFAVSRLADVETAFAMTVHKSQGSEFAHTVLVLPAEQSLVATRELVYTGITRAREALTVVARHDAAIVEAVGRTAQRSSGLHDLLAR